MQPDRPYVDFPSVEGPSIASTAPSAPPLPALPQHDASPLEIIQLVAQSYAIAADDITGKDKHKNIAEARQVTCFLIRMLTKLSFPEIGRVLRKDHTSVMVCVKKCTARRAKDMAFCAFTDKLLAAVDARVKDEAAA